MEITLILNLLRLHILLSLLLAWLKYVLIRDVYLRCLTDLLIVCAALVSLSVLRQNLSAIIVKHANYYNYWL